jgi:hypothetical protein
MLVRYLSAKSLALLLLVLFALTACGGGGDDEGEKEKSTVLDSDFARLHLVTVCAYRVDFDGNILETVRDPVACGDWADIMLGEHLDGIEECTRAYDAEWAGYVDDASWIGENGVLQNFENCILEKGVEAP